jgi:uncharacterized protein (DUF305 family)
MDTKALLFGIIGFLMGGLVVSSAATLLDEDGAAADEMTMSQMSDELENKTGNDFDAAFITAMIEHHEGAIDMAELAASRASHEEIKQLSLAIISAQEGEIAEMKEWQHAWGYDDAHGGGHSADE